jgi:hypothetical protein
MRTCKKCGVQTAEALCHKCGASVLYQPSPPADCCADLGLRQTIYEHGGSRMWLEKNGERKLLVDTYTTDNFAKAIRAFTEEWLRHNDKVERRAPSTFAPTNCSTSGGK